jgi:hypothetical protein
LVKDVARVGMAPTGRGTAAVPVGNYSTKAQCLRGAHGSRAEGSSSTLPAQGVPGGIVDVRLVLHMLQRRSLDRVKFWNICAQSNSLPVEVRESARAQRLLEADHRQRLREMRRALKPNGAELSTEGLARWRLPIRERVREGDVLTRAVQTFLTETPSVGSPRWLLTLRSRSSWFADALSAGPASAGGT